MASSLSAWLNRFGLFFAFISFWFAAPEILGEKRLKGMLAYAGILLYVLLPISIVVAAVIALALLPPLYPALDTPVFPYAIFLVSAALFNFIREDAKGLLDIDSFITTLARRQRMRQKYLAIGALLFVVGFILQLAATF